MNKKIGQKLLFALFFLCSFVFCEAYAENSRPIAHVVTLFNYAPYCFTKPPQTNVLNEIIPQNEDSKHLRGYAWDVMREALHRAGYTIDLSVMPWIRAFSDIKNNEYDIIFPVTLSTHRKQFLRYSALPIIGTNLLLYVRKDNSLQWRGIENLPKMSIAHVRSYSYGDRWLKAPGHVRKVPVERAHLCISMVAAGRVDACAGYEDNWDYLIRKMDLSSKLRKLPPFDTTGELAGSHKNNTHGRLILNDLDKEVAAMHASGRIDLIRRNWGLPPLSRKSPQP